MDFLRKAENGNFDIWHNGNFVHSCKSGKGVIDYIAYILNMYIDSDPRLIVDEVLGTCPGPDGKYIVLVYEYNVDKCREFFFIESNRNRMHNN